jgi:hypothetical protein
LMSRLRNEDGSALALCLVFLSVFGVLISVLLSFASTSLRVSTVMVTQGRINYDVDAAVEAAIQRARTNAGDCFNPGAFNGTAALTVTCTTSNTTTVENAGGRPGQAILTLGTGGETGLTKSSNSSIYIGGNVYSNSSVDVTGSMTVRGDGRAKTCGGSGSFLSAGGTINCAYTGAETDPNYVPKYGTDATLTAPPTSRTPPACPLSGTVTLLPGTYSSATALNALTDNSGVGSCSGRVINFTAGQYFFNFPDSSPVWNITGSATYVVGGTYTGVTPLSFPGSCDQSLPGVMFVFGGQSRINLTDASMELCQPPSGGSAVQRIALYGVKPIPSVTLSPTTTTASAQWTPNPDKTRVIDADAATYTLTAPNPTATATLGGICTGCIPSGYTIEKVLLAIAHTEADPSRLNSLAVQYFPSGGATGVTIPPDSSSTCGSTVGITSCAGLHTDTIDVTSGLDTAAKLNGVTISYTAVRRNGSPSVGLDGAQLIVTYSAPLRGQTGCVIAAGGCELLTTNGNPARVVLWGTTYAPAASVNINLPGQNITVIRRGIITRRLVIGVPASGSTLGPIEVPTTEVASGRVVTFVARVNGTTKLTADVSYDDVLNTVTVTKWAVER